MRALYPPCTAASLPFSPHTHTHTCTQSLSLSHTHTHTHTQYLSFTHTQTQTHYLSLSHTHTHTVSFFHTQTHTHTLMHAYTHSHTHKHTGLIIDSDIFHLIAAWLPKEPKTQRTELCLSLFPFLSLISLQSLCLFTNPSHSQSHSLSFSLR